MEKLNKYEKTTMVNDISYLIPKDYILVPDPAIQAMEDKQAEIDMLQAQIDAMTEPTDKELIEYGRIVHPYYQEKLRLKTLINQ
jgi:hypothetical protein